MDDTLVVLAKLIGLMAAFAALIWVAAEAIGAAFRISKIGIAMVLGVVGGIILTGTKLFDVPGVEAPLWEMALGALLGMLCAVAASKGINDQIVNRIKGPRAGAGILLMAILPGVWGCAVLRPPTVEYVRADVDFEALMGPEIERWIAQDQTLTLAEKDALRVSLRAWRLMVKRAADANGIPHVIATLDGERVILLAASGERLELPVSVLP